MDWRDVPREILDRVCRIPVALAATYSRGNQDLYDLMLSEAGYRLTLAIGQFDPVKNRNGMEGLGPFVYESVKKATRTVWSGKTRFQKKGRRLIRFTDMESQDGLKLDVPDDSVENLWEIRELIDKVLGVLKDDDRKIFVRHYGQGEPCSEIAEQMGMSKEGVRRRVIRLLALAVLEVRKMGLELREPESVRNLVALDERRQKNRRSQREIRPRDSLPVWKETGKGYWYLIDIKEKTITGPFDFVSTCLGYLGLDVSQVSRKGSARSQISKFRGNPKLENKGISNGKEARGLRDFGYRFIDLRRKAA